MAEIRNTINKDLIFLDLGGSDISFTPEEALAHLLMNEVVFLNSWWSEKGIRKEIKDHPRIFVNCNDVFAWACADGEDLPFHQIETLYKLWEKDPVWGPAIWCMTQRKEMPQKPVEDDIRERGIWDLDSLDLNENTMDDWVQAQFALCAQKLREGKNEETQKNTN